MRRLTLLIIMIFGVFLFNTEARSKSTKVDLQSFRITKPIGLFDFNTRRAELEADTELAESLCGIKLARPRGASAVKVVGHGTKYTIFNQPNPFRKDISWISSQVDGWLRTGEESFLETLRDWMLASANAGSLTKLIPDPDKYHFADPLFNLRFILKPTFVAYDLLRQTGFLNLDESKQILEWLEPIVKNSDKRGCEGTWKCYPDSKPGEHWTLHDYTTLMMWGAVSGDNYYFQRGVEFYIKSLNSLRSDGSSQEVGERKKYRSLKKQNEDVGYLVIMAEMAARQGYDLYSVGVDGKSVFKAFEYLIKGIGNPSSVYKGKAQELAPAAGTGQEKTILTSQKLGFLNESSHADSTTAWFEPFARRWPKNHASKKFSSSIKARRPLNSAAYGGNLSCFFGASSARYWSKRLKVSSGLLTNKHDGEYSVRISCEWAGYGKGNISPWNVWTIKEGRLLEKKGKWDIQGQLIGEKVLEIKGARQAKAGSWSNADMRVEFDDNGQGMVTGKWKNGDCKGSFNK